MDEVFTPEIVLDRSAGLPLYEQIAQPIEQAILSGTLAPGTRIEDEVSMAQRLDVARPTARRALQELASKGLLTRRRGVGTQVTPPHVHRPMRLSSLNQDLADAGFTPSTKILSYAVREATETEASKLEIKPGDGILDVRRLRFADAHPLAILTNTIPLDIAPSWQMLSQEGLYACLRQQGVEIAAASQEIGARGATPDEAATLTETPGTPLLTMQRVGRTAEGRAVEFGQHVYRPSLYSFQFSLFAG